MSSVTQSSNLSTLVNFAMNFASTDTGHLPAPSCLTGAFCWINTHGAPNTKCEVPWHNSSFGQTAFSVQGINMWNSILFLVGGFLQFQQGPPDFLLPGHISQLWLRDPRVVPRPAQSYNLSIWTSACQGASSQLDMPDNTSIGKRTGGILTR